MDINRTNMDALFTGFNLAFRDAFAKATDNSHLEWCTPLPSGTKIEEFPFIEQISGMREWLGPRHIKNIATKKLTIVNRTFEDTVGIPVNDIEDDRYGMYTPIVGQIGANAANLEPELAIAALVGNGLWLDGAAFFGTTRKYGASTISNYTTGALTPTTYGTARIAMMSYTGHGKGVDGGQTPLNVVPDLLIVGPKLETMGKNILENEFWYDATDKVQLNNPYKGTARLQVNTRLVGTYDDYWFLASTKGVVKPVIISRRQSPVLVRKDRQEDDNVFFEDKIVYGTKARGEAALGFPHLVYGGFVA